MGEERKMEINLKGGVNMIRKFCFLLQDLRYVEKPDHNGEKILLMANKIQQKAFAVVLKKGEKLEYRDYKGEKQEFSSYLKACNWIEKEVIRKGHITSDQKEIVWKELFLFSEIKDYYFLKESRYWPLIKAFLTEEEAIEIFNTGKKEESTC